MVRGRRIRSRKRWATALAGALLAIALVACGNINVTEPGATCVTDSDCASGEHCALTGPGLRPMAAPPCPTSQTRCGTDSDCPSGQVCEELIVGGKTYCGKECVAGCPSIPCNWFESCENARCRALLCDEVGGPNCDYRWRCDPLAAADEPLEIFGSREPDLYAQDLIDVGCVRLRCDEATGFICKESGWVCDPENATDGSGCVALPCEELGACSDSDFICTTTSVNPRPAGVDPHGCVQRNCEEGAECTILNRVDGNVGYCDFAGPFADALGCATKPCQSDAGCESNEICDPGSGNRFGCRTRTCEEGYSCRAGLRCDQPPGGFLDCVSDSSGSMAGSGGASTAGSGGASTSGATGRCIAD